MAKIDLSFFELRRIKPQRCRCQARRAVARRRRNNLRVVGEAVALDSQDHVGKDKEKVHKGHAPQTPAVLVVDHLAVDEEVGASTQQSTRSAA